MNKIFKFIYDALFYLDEKLGYLNKYRGESAPYCGHSYNGHSGKFTGSAYNEGDGVKWAIVFFWVVAECNCTEEQDWYIQTKKRFNKYYKRF
jgi:hypothetical protein